MEEIGTWQDDRHVKTVVARPDRAIQYPAASRHYRSRLWILGRPVKPGDDSCISRFIGVGPKAGTELGKRAEAPVGRDMGGYKDFAMLEMCR
ncbi:MAG: hypothetical protein ABIL01_29930 [Pseudomonadota bacterium]